MHPTESSTTEPAAIAAPPAMLDYREPAADDPFREKGWWVAAAAAVMAGLALVQQAVNFALYLFPGAFFTVSSGLSRGGSTSWGMMAATIASAGLSLAMFIAALLYLRGRDTRTALVRLAVVHILFSFAVSGFVQYTYFRDKSAPDRVIHIFWMVGSMVQGSLVDALVAVFFYRRKARRRADRLSPG
jgi:hypothetical protein